MSKSVHDDVLDGALNVVKNNATRICVCSTQPTTYTEAITTYKLAIKTITSADFTGPAFLFPLVSPASPDSAG